MELELAVIVRIVGNDLSWFQMSRNWFEIKLNYGEVRLKLNRLDMKLGWVDLFTSLFGSQYQPGCDLL